MARFDQTKLTLRILFENVTSAAGLLIVLGYIMIAIIDAVHPQLIGVVNAFEEVPDYTNPVPQPPSLQHLFGTTYPGIDLYQAVIAAIRVDLWYSFVIVLAGALVGILVGVVAAYYSGFFDEILMRITDIFLSIPYLPFAIAVGFVLGRGLDELSLALVIVWWPLYARYARGQALSIKENAYVEAARASGVGSWGIITKHIVPNVLTPVFVQISLDLGTVVQTFAALTFIGFASANPLLPELGKLISDGFPYAISAPWVVIFPGVTILIFAVAMNLLGDGLRDALDPRNRT
ncbi:MAG TPA: ABC transporter permease [Nitrososphaerales archaeon]|nr:ABC transporter permease [Nitrososphaerales archaeon]